MPDVLLIDDDDDEYFIFTDATNGFNPPVRCTHARGAGPAMHILRVSCPDIIFVDMNMPGVNGICCIGQIRDIIGEAMPPVILYSTRIDAALAADALAAGASGCLQKPDTAGQLTESLRPLFDKDD